MRNIGMSIISPLGTELPLATNAKDPGDFHVMLGTNGFGLPTPVVTSTDSAGDGRRIGNVRVAGRTVILPIDVQGGSRAETEDHLNALADAISYVDGKPLPRLRAYYASGEAREVEFLHVGGGTESFDDDENAVSWILTLDCPDPYWTSVEYSSFVVQQNIAPTGFLESLPNVYLLPSNAFGDLTVTNPGRVDSWIDWELHGPFTQVGATSDLGSWTFTDSVDEGQTIFVQKTPTGIEVVDETGANRYDAVDDVPVFFRLPAGSNRLAVSVLGANTATKVVGRFRPRHRLVF